MKNTSNLFNYKSVIPSRAFFLLNGKILGNLDYYEFMRTVESRVKLRKQINTLNKLDILKEINTLPLPPEEATIAYAYDNELPLKLRLSKLKVKDIVKHYEQIA